MQTLVNLNYVPKKIFVTVSVKTPQPQRIKVRVYNPHKENTEYYTRELTMRGTQTFQANIPKAPQQAMLEVYNVSKGVNAKNDETYKAYNLHTQPLLFDYAMGNLSDPMVKSFVNFASDFCENAGWWGCGVYMSDDKKYKINFMESVPIPLKNGKTFDSMMRISTKTGEMQVSQNRIKKMSVPARFCVVGHEFGHIYKSKDVYNEFEADDNALKLYFALKFPVLECGHGWLEVFKNSATDENVDRWLMIKKKMKEYGKNI